MSLSENEILIGPGVAPDGRPATFYVEKEILYALMDYGPQSKYEDCRFLIEAVANPDAIFELPAGLEQFENFCYSVRPTYDPDEPDNETLPRYGVAFVVCLKKVDDEYLAYDWEWQPEDQDNPGLPEDRDELGRQLWPSN